MPETENAEEQGVVTKKQNETLTEDTKENESLYHGATMFTKNIVIPTHISFSLAYWVVYYTICIGYFPTDACRRSTIWTGERIYFMEGGINPWILNIVFFFLIYFAYTHASTAPHVVNTIVFFTFAARRKKCVTKRVACDNKDGAGVGMSLQD